MYLIEAQTNLAEVNNFDVFAFVRYLENNLQIFS